ncbi:Uncharacterized protein FKW44_023830 [Caligus rogercresseyi]|uniref:Uncharacterized protein n=1 Tax=Caligus rogercresseyi TaxID=217165 RepID=A0A7T8GQ66_CALRO|nr:Uncharacterized protein FKW44_023830 [Caligus rogercresseyi]
MVLGVISSEGDVMPPPPTSSRRASRSTRPSHRRHEESRREALDGPGGEWEALCLPAGLGSAHKSRETQAWLMENLPYHWSPDLGPPAPLTATPSTISSGAWSRTRQTSTLTTLSTPSGPQLCRSSPI